MLLESKLRGPRTRAAIASLLADVDDDEDDATVAMSLGDAEDEELLTGGNLSSKERATISYTTAQFHETKLLKLLNDAQAPHYLYEQILSWAEQAKLEKYSFAPQRKSRANQINHLKKWLGHDKVCDPEEVPTNLPLADPDDPPLQVNITRFNFTSQLYSLLQDSRQVVQTV